MIDKIYKRHRQEGEFRVHISCPELTAPGACSRLRELSLSPKGAWKMSAGMGREIPSCPSPPLTQLFSSPTGFRNWTAQTLVLGGRRRPAEVQVTACEQKSDDCRGPGAAPGCPAAGRQVRRPGTMPHKRPFVINSLQYLQLKCCQYFFSPEAEYCKEYPTNNSYSLLSSGCENQKQCTLYAFKSFPSKVIPIT